MTEQELKELQQRLDYNNVILARAKEALKQFDQNHPRKK